MTRSSTVWTALFLATTLLASAAAARADTLVLTDGSTLDGTIKKTDGGYDVLGDDGAKTFVPDARVAAFRLGGGGGADASAEPADAVDPGLASLRRSVANLDDLAAIIARYERFVEQNEARPAVAAGARGDLERYRGFRDDGFVRFNGEWVAPAARAAALKGAFQEVSAARLQIKSGDLAAAGETVDKMLAGDPENVSGLYLAGVLAQQAGDVAGARGSFEKVRRRLPEHAPTLVNLAAISLKYNQQPRGLTFLNDAMRVEPGNREVLDNVAEALAMLDDRAADSRQAELARRTFEAQDAALQRQMEAKGLFRWGSKWVAREQREQFEAARERVRQAVAEVEAERAELRAQIKDVDRQAADNAAYMQQVDRSRNYVDKDGNVIRGPMPPVYFDAQRRQGELLRDRQGREAQLAALDGAVEREEAKLPAPAYDGALRPIGEDGVPVTLPPAAVPLPVNDNAPATEPDEAASPATTPATNEAVPDLPGTPDLPVPATGPDH